MEEIIKNEDNVQKAKHSIPKWVIIVGCVLIVCVLIAAIYFVPEYIKNKTFNNGICGDYTCTDVSFTSLGEDVYGDKAEAVVTLSLVGKNITVYSDGQIDDLYENYSPKMKYSGSLFGFPHAMCIEYELTGSQPEDNYILRADYYNKDRNETESDLIYLSISTDDMPEGRSAYTLKFEKVD